MSIKRLNFWVGAILLLAASATELRAQIISEADNEHMTGPFIEPDTFKSDLQFFAPPEVDQYSGFPQPNTGFYLKYQYLYMNVSRPAIRREIGARPNILFPQTPIGSQLNQLDIDQRGLGDFAPGNRWNFGWVSDDGVGWHAVVTKIRSAGVIDHELFRLQSLEPWPLINSTANDQNINSFEVNRSLGRNTMSYGVVEPFIGFRYMRNQTRDWWAQVATAVDDGGGGGGGTENAYRLQTHADNNLVMGQLGFRHFRHSGHWKFSSEVRFFGGQNFQRYTGVARYQETTYAAAAGGGQVVTVGADIETRTVFNRTTLRRNEESVWGGEINLETDYQFTKHIALNFGTSFLLTNGSIARGRNTLLTYPDLVDLPPGLFPDPQFLTFNNDYMRLAGLYCGININR